MLEEEVVGPVDAEAVFADVFAGSPAAFWLDGQVAGPEGTRRSHLGDGSGPLAHRLRARAGAGVVEVLAAGGATRESGDVLDALRRRLGATGDAHGPLGGYVGYLGYEVGVDCGAAAAGPAPDPDAQWQFVDRLVTVDHDAGTARVAALTDGTPQVTDEQAAWVRATAARIAALAPLPETEPEDAPAPLDPAAGAAHLVRDRDTYLADVRACLAALRAGESYEICLTNALERPAPADPFAFYRRLRRTNPAPYAAYLRFDDLVVAGSSPERFLRIAGGVAESRPIKGTAPRGAGPAQDREIRDALAADPKTRAENLMIVDLLRNDLTRVCDVGTVETRGLMAVETYATVHQMVTTIRGRLRPGVTTADAVRACFPPGSMTGAPKRRTTQICAELEGAPRGVYSGALGWIGPGGADLAVVIRTAVIHGGVCRIGAGGAVVLDSDPVAEYDEMLLKAAAPLRALGGT